MFRTICHILFGWPSPEPRGVLERPALGPAPPPPCHAQPPAGRDEFEFWEPKERLIFSYRKSAGEPPVFKDPLLLYRRFAAIAPELAVDMQLAASPHSQAEKGHEDSIKKICRLFEVERLSDGGQGLTDDEIIDLFDDFMLFTHQLKKKLSRYVTSSTPTAASSPSSPPPPATPCTSVSGSTVGGSSSAGPPPSPME